MNTKQTQKLLSFAIAVLTALSTLVAHDDAKAAQLAFLQSCSTATSVTGRLIYVGTYSINGQTFQQTFATWCPQSLSVQ